MLIIDILVIVVIIAFAANGFKAGSIETLGRVLGAVIGFIAARTLVAWVVGYVSHFIGAQWAFLVSFLIIFLAVDSLIGFLFRLAESLLKIFTRLPILKQINSFLGLIFGLIEGIIVIGGVSWLMERSSVQAGVSFLSGVTTIHWINGMFTWLFSIIL
jgi:uncharacterized membrane protein required for colicin V production